MYRSLRRLIHRTLKETLNFGSLCARYGFWNSVRVEFSLLRNQNIRVPINRSQVLFNPEPATKIHLLDSVDKIKRLVASIPTDECETILDIGANCGLFSLLARERYPASTIFAFEPSESLIHILQSNLKNRNVEIVPMAVGNVDGKVDFFINPASQQTNSMMQDYVTNYSSSGAVSRHTVPCVKLDTFVKRHKVKRIDIIKIDVQGAEKMVFDGGKNTIMKAKYLLVEICLNDNDVVDLLLQLRKMFPYSRLINPVVYGADILFSKQAL